MKPSLIPRLTDRMLVTGALAAIAVAFLATGCGGKSTAAKTVIVPSPADTVTATETVTVAATSTVAVAKTGVGPPGEIVELGYINSLTRKGGHFEMEFDPAWFLSGLTASQAALEDTGSSDVPNDYYRVDEGHRLLTYLVAADARVTVLAKGVSATPISVSQLAQIVDGKQPLGHPLFEPITTGFWILVDIDTVRSLDQQYVP